MNFLQALGRFLRRRGVLFWLGAPVLVIAICAGAWMYPDDREGERVARRLDGVTPVPVDKVIWHVDGGYVEGVAVIVPDSNGIPFTLDLTGVEGYDEVSSHGGWQPSHANDGGPRYQPGMLVRYDLGQNPPIGMAEIDRGRLRDGIPPSRMDLGLVVVASPLLALLLGWYVRRDRFHATPRKRLPFLTKYGDWGKAKPKRKRSS